MRETAKHRKQKALRALLEHSTIREAAEAAGLDESTIYRYLSDEKFKQQYREARRQIMTATIGRIQTAAGSALAELMRIIESDTARPYVKVQACKAVLEMAFKAAELEQLEEIEERISTLEKQVNSA